ncbi:MULTISPECIES: DUF3108 domain-containing protein [unclassified Lentilitoribacter]|jgi:hypothetical protein|uniref:DUF3108 domain-containing protein n=1 Tax=unclassified Lentilitoribacter TaxID=2647570 RepID=UPI0013A702B5|nr:DUF3108 domain-containing protein [Lentilitoribacter sp. Alg239-R112]
MKKMKLKNLFVFTALSCVFTTAALPSVAAAKTANSSYKLVIHGITLAKLNFKTEISGETFKTSGSIKSSSLADIVAKIRGETTVTGKVTPHMFRADQYKINYTSGDEKRAFDVLYNENGKVTQSKISPEPKSRPSDWVKLKDADLLSVVDPITSLTLPYKGPKSPVCGRTVSIFDGETLVDLKLKFIGHARYKTKGFRGRVVKCQVTFTPKGGYRANHDSVKYLQQAKGMEVWFGVNKHMNAHVPMFAKIPTKIGDVRVSATEIGS